MTNEPRPSGNVNSTTLIRIVLVVTILIALALWPITYFVGRYSARRQLEQSAPRFSAQPAGPDALRPYTTPFVYKADGRLSNHGPKLTTIEFTADDWKAIGRITELEELTISNDGQFRDEYLQYISGLKSLRFLRLSNVALTDKGLGYISQMPSIQVLTLNKTLISDAGLKALKELPKLQMLEMASTQISDKGMKELTALHGLVYLNVNHTPITDQGIQSICTIPQLQNLSAASPALTNGAASAISGLTKLEYLDLSGTRIDDDGLLALAELRNLRQLHLIGTNVSDRGIAIVANFTKLERLSLDGTGITDAGAKFIPSSVNDLGLSHTGITDLGIAELSLLNTTHSQFSIDVSDCPGISDTSVPHLVGVTTSGMYLVDFRRTSITPDGSDQLSQRSETTYLMERDAAEEYLNRKSRRD